MNSAKVIQDKWAAGQCPIIDGILYSDGRLIEFTYTSTTGTNGLHVTPERETNVATILSDEPDRWTHLTQMDTEVDRNREMKVVCGGGAYGSDGYVGVVDLKNESLQWLAFFQRSNPFCNVTCTNNIVQAATTLGSTWDFPLDKPEHVTITLEE